MCAAGSSFPEGDKSSMFCFSAPAFTCLLTPSHTGQALEHEPCRSLSRSIRRSQTWFDWPATSQWLKNKGDACATCSFGLPCYWLLHLQEIASVSFLQWSVPLPFVPRPLVSCQLTLCPLLPARFILSILPFHFPSSGRVQTNSVWMFCRMELTCDLISVKNLNSIDICQRLHLYFVGAPKLQNSMENTLGHKHPTDCCGKKHICAVFHILVLLLANHYSAIHKMLIHSTQSPVWCCRLPVSHGRSPET